MDIIIKDKEQAFNVGRDGAGVIKRVLVHHKAEFYIISENTALGETLIFQASPTGEVTDWYEVGGGKDRTLNEVLADIEQHLFKTRYF